MNIEDLLGRMVKEGASDGFITAGAPPSIKVDGEIHPISTRHLLSRRRASLYCRLCEKISRKIFRSTMNVITR